MPVPIAINVPNVPPPCIIDLPTVFNSSRPRNPYLDRPNDVSLHKTLSVLLQLNTPQTASAEFTEQPVLSTVPQ